MAITIVRMATDELERLKTALTDRYRVESELGRGGMATVYAAEDLRHGRRVALKVLRPELAHAIGPARFLKEIAIAARLTHPNILPLHDSGDADGLLYYVMPYVEGESLRQRLTSEKQLPVEEAIRIAHDAASALTHAHRQGVIHRDVKPENILLVAGRAVVCDFGIARAIDAAESERLTETGLALGTPAYMSPEQASGEPTVDARSDVYALGCVLYEMLAGEPPFTGPTPQAVIAKRLVDPVPSVRRLRETIPATVDRALKKALAKVPADRFDTPEQFAAAVHRGLTASSGRSARVPELFRARIFQFTGALGIALAGALWLIDARGAPTVVHPSSVVVLPFENLSGDPDQEYLVAGMHDALIGELAQVAALRVISRTSAMRYRGTDKSIPEIARDLNVGAVVEASFTRVGDSVRIRMQLIQALPQEQNLWSQVAQREISDLIMLHREAALAIARALNVRLAPGETERLAQARRVDPDAYDAYLNGRFHWYKLTPSDVATALDYFQLALEKEPQYALAHSGIASVWAFRGHYGLLPPRAAYGQAKSSALRALELDPALSEAHASLATVLTWYEWDWSAAEEAFQRALELNPSNAHARAFYSFLLAGTGRLQQGRAQIERALELDPHNSFFHWVLGLQLLWAGRNDEAIAQFHHTLGADPRSADAQAFLADALHQKGLHDDALAVRRRLMMQRNDTVLAAVLDRGQAEGGYQQALRGVAATLAARSDERYVNPWGIARLYALAGDAERAFEWLERAYEARAGQLVFTGIHPAFESLRSDERFRSLSARMNMPS